MDQLSTSANKSSYLSSVTRCIREKFGRTPRHTKFTGKRVQLEYNGLSSFIDLDTLPDNLKFSDVQHYAKQAVQAITHCIAEAKLLGYVDVRYSYGMPGIVVIEISVSR